MSELTTTSDSLVRPAPSASVPPARSFAKMVMVGALKRVGAQMGVAWVALLVLLAVFSPFIANTHPYILIQDDQWSFPLFRFLTVSDVLLLLVTALVIIGLFFRKLTVFERIRSGICVMGLVIPASCYHSMLKPFFTTYSMSEQGDALGNGTWSIVLLGFAIYLAILVWVIVGMLRTRMLPMTFKIGVFTLAGVVMLALVLWPISPPRVVVYDLYRTEAAAGNVQWQLRAPLPFSPADRLRDVRNSRLLPPTLEHPLGTTNHGADLASNMIYASRIALSIGFISTGIAVCIGVVIGGLMGYFSGWVDLFGMRLVEIFSAIPTFILLLTFVAAFGANLYVIMVIIGLTSWVGDAIFIRAEFLRLRKQDFVQAAIAAGLPLRSILFRHMLPNGIAPVLVSASFGVAGAILAESTLSFLGIGLQAETSWGKLLNDALGSSGTFYWWLALYPGLAIFLTVFAYNLVGEALRDAIDPHLQKAAQI